MSFGSNSWMLYGANGYTGRLVARHSVSVGLKPILAGRDANQIGNIARDLDCPSRIFPLTSLDTIAEQLQGVSAVLLCAGPFSRTAQPMIEACLRKRIRYFDITGEIEVIEYAARQYQRAIDAGISLMPAIGFDVVPSDCLAAKLAEALPSADELDLAFTAIATLSPGTAKTMWERLGDGGRVRQNGQIVRVPAAWKTAEIPFPSGKQPAVTIPWGDVASAYYTTGIPNIRVFAALPKLQHQWLPRLRWLLPLTRLSLVQNLGRRLIEKNFHGPTEAEQSAGRAELWGQVRDKQGRSVEATLVTPEGYALTVQTAAEIVRRTLNGQVGSGFFTPAKAFGAGFIEQFPRVEFRLSPNSTVIAH